MSLTVEQLITEVRKIERNMVRYRIFCAPEDHGHIERAVSEILGIFAGLVTVTSHRHLPAGTAWILAADKDNAALRVDWSDWAIP